MAQQLSPSQLDALRELVDNGTLTADQAVAVRARLEAAPAGEGRGSRAWVAEAAGYLGGALTFAGAALLVGLSWEQLSRPGRVTVLGLITAVLAVAGVAIAGGPRRVRAMAGEPGTVRRRVVSVLFALAAGTAALTAGVAATDHEPTVAGVTGLVVAAIGYLLLPTLPVLLTAAAMSALAGTAVAGDFVGDTPLRLGLTLLVVAVLWAALPLSRLPSGLRRHRSAALVVAGLIGLLGAQLVLGDSAASGWAYALTLLVAVGCLGAYALDRSILLLAVGVVGVTLAVAEAVADWTDGAAGGAAAVLAAGAVLLLGSSLALRLHRRHSL